MFFSMFKSILYKSRHTKLPNQICQVLYTSIVFNIFTVHNRKRIIFFCNYFFEFVLNIICLSWFSKYIELPRVEWKKPISVQGRCISENLCTRFFFRYFKIRTYLIDCLNIFSTQVSFFLELVFLVSTISKIEQLFVLSNNFKFFEN